MKGESVQCTLLSSFGRIRYFAVLRNEMFSVNQSEPLFWRGAPHQRIHVCIRGVSAAAAFVLYNQCVCQALAFALGNRLPDGLGGKNGTTLSHLLMLQSFRIGACILKKEKRTAGRRITGAPLFYVWLLLEDEQSISGKAQEDKASKRAQQTQLALGNR